MKIKWLSVLLVVLALASTSCTAENPANVASSTSSPIYTYVTNPASGSSVVVTNNTTADNPVYVIAKSYEYGVAEGDVTGHSAFQKNGWQPSVSTSLIDVWGVAAVYVPPASAMQMSIKSDNAADAAAGTGIRTIELHYLDNTYAEKIEILTLNGTTWVDTAATNILRVQSLHALTVGSAAYAVGNINIVDKATRTISYAVIVPGFNRSFTSFWTVPAGKTLYVTSFQCSASSSASKNARFILKATVNDGVKTSTWMGQGQILVQDGAGTIAFTVPLKIPATCDMKVSVIGSGSLSAACYIDGWLE